MASLPQLTAAPLEFTANGKTYLVHPLTDKDFGELLAWVQSEIIEAAKKMIAQMSVGTPMPDEDRQALLRHAFDAVRRVTLSSPEFNEHLISIEGGIRLAWCALRYRQPEITKAEVTEILMDPELGAELMKKIDALRELHSVAPFPAKVSKKAMRQAKKRPRPLTRQSTEG